MTRNRLSVCVVLVALIAAMWMSTVADDGPAILQENVIGELAGIREALEGLNAHLSRIQRNSDADVVLRQMQLYEQRLAPLDSRLAGLNSEYKHFQTELAKSTVRLAQTEARVENIKRAGRTPIPEDLVAELDSVIRSVEWSRARVEVIREQQIELDNRVAKRREDMAILEERLLELLDVD